MDAIVRLFDHPRSPDYAQKVLKRIEQIEQLLPNFQDSFSITWINSLCNNPEGFGVSLTFRTIVLHQLDELQCQFIDSMKINVTIQKIFANKNVDVELAGKISQEHGIPLDLLRPNKPNAPYNQTLNVLGVAALQGDTKAISCLLRMKANVNYANDEDNNFQRPALLAAATSPHLDEKGKLRTVRLLLNEKANPYQRDPLHGDCYWSAPLDYSKMPLSVFQMIMESDSARNLRQQAGKIGLAAGSLMRGLCTRFPETLWLQRFTSYGFKCDPSERPLRQFFGGGLQEKADQMAKILDESTAFRESELKKQEDEQQLMAPYTKPESTVLAELLKSWPIAVIDLVKQQLFETEDRVSIRVARYCIVYFESQVNAVG